MDASITNIILMLESPCNSSEVLRKHLLSASMLRLCIAQVSGYQAPALSQPRCEGSSQLSRGGLVQHGGS